MRRGLSKRALVDMRARQHATELRLGAGVLCLFILCAGWPAQLHGQSDDKVPASECCLETLFPVGARTVALGQALTARSGTDGMFINPASLAQLARTEFVVHRSTIGEDPMTTMSLLVHSKVAGVFGLTYRFIDYGDFSATDESGNVIGTSSTTNQLLIASYATTFTKSWAGGLSYRLYNLNEQCQGNCGSESHSGTTTMLDVGVTYHPQWLQRLALGASLMHTGLKLQVKNAPQADVTPKRLRIGGAYDVGGLITKDSTTAVWLHVDLVQRLHDVSAPGINVGVEVILDNTIFFRAGHASEAEGTSFGGNAVGIGLKYQRFDVSVAKSVTSSGLFQEPFYVSFGIGF